MDESYRDIADDYDQTFATLPFRGAIEEHSILKLLGDVRGLSVLDVACGTGLYSRTLLRRGAARVVGVDISEDMLRVARENEAQQPLGAVYHLQDVADLSLGEVFDRALGVYLLHYAASRAQLVTMGRAIAQHLAPGGRFVTFVANPDASPDPEYYVPFGLRMEGMPGPAADGQAFTFSLWLDGAWTAGITNYRWSRGTLEAALREAGFAEVREVPLSVAPDALAQGDARWQRYIDRPHCILLEATMPGAGRPG